MAVIKATDRQSGLQSHAFNFEDMADQAKAYVQQVRQQAKEIVERAQREADAIRGQIETEAREEAERSIGPRVEQLLEQRLETLAPAIDAIQRARRDWLAHWEQRAVHVAAAIAKRVIRRELDKAPEIPLALVREALELATGSPRIRIRLNPGDHPTLSDSAMTIAERLTPLAQAEVVADESVSPGGCVLETQHGVIDQTFEAQLARIEEELN